ncbi:GH35 family endo-1,4-beta-xylanase/putative cell wall-binding protein [Microbacteriaceae bacterium SG_E_30_P1]|uniref:Beta-xylanase n=1 Tax=Antiquaquibacter oligotrophicus TaxID=2880260 RepID=A0ABT6KQC4_9MICO|nr:endo-1,4-beta-xylanase [Antiquaquibacter oligotrophicus]MDH6182174.1 GH35 family endo-1,4-beta-xylanase/putative cell wall-binding protein [Antiquaquibacter oligotrophicus]UDF12164.1 endo-1,4-beta-xylanase [Antiquaquibacter oligotrophicus]
MRTRRIATVIAVLALAGSVVVATPAVSANYPATAVDFNDGTLGGWSAFGIDGSNLAVVTEGGESFLRVSSRASDYSGIASPTGLLVAGKTYTMSMRVRLAAGTANTEARFVVQPGYTWVGNTPVVAGQWTTVTGTYEVPTDAASDTLSVYLGTGNLTGPYTYDVDDIRITRDTSMAAIAPFPIGVAIDQRETTGTAAAAVLEDYSQLTAENHMKPDSFYDGQRNRRLHPQAIAIMDFAQANDLSVYGHVLAWHSQTPSWLFQNSSGQALTTSETDRQILRDRLRAHIFGVADLLATRYGEFGGGNPVVAFDVVNEVIDDSASYQDGMRRSEWYRILGEEFVDLAFHYADEAFNETYAAAGADRPVTLFINEYSTEWAGKRDRYQALVTRLLARGVPVDGVGHQFHVTASINVGQLRSALDAFSGLPVTQAVTELDAVTGTPVTPARLTTQENFYRSAFELFTEKADDLYSVTFWGLRDGRSWRSADGAPLLLDDSYNAKPAYRGVIDALEAAYVEPEPERIVDRIGGATRYDVAVGISQAAYPTTAPVVYVVNGEAYPDALSAGPAAALEGGPLLLVRPNEVPAAIAAEITRLDPARIVVVGGPASVGESVFTQLAGLAEEIDRVAGADRFEVSRAVAEYAFGDVEYAYVATGEKFPDALSAGGAAGVREAPVILVRGSSPSLDAATAGVLGSLSAERVRVLGGEASVSAGVFADLAARGEAVRLGGADRYEAARTINADAFDTAERVLIATGINFPDALAGSAWAAAAGAPLFVVPGSCVTPGVLADIDELGASHVTLLGGEASLSPAVAALTPCG